ncbi:A-kinase anchor protein 17A isoform X2 [Cloeon dipterum]|uniref:A-kinase anchor protein 17A isoform X2 n=1 Tax=Cloeon dipterum TaxID=197152 RepID=UPI00321F8842
MMLGKSVSSNACRSCSDTSDIVPLNTSQHLYLKPIARMNISVQLPQMKAPGKSISSWEVMERLKKMAKPEKFSILKVTKSTLEFIRFEGEIDSKAKLKSVIDKLDMMTIKLSGFTDALKVRAAEAKLPFPTRHVWDSFFREAKNMNEMKPGERPDTIHISNLPCRWFTLPELQEKEPKPSEYIFRKVFESYGEVRYVDVPCIDPYRSRMKNKSGIKTFSFDDGVMFEGYVQFKEYVGFLKAMSALKGMHLMYKEKDKVLVASIRVDFDRTKHMTDHAIKKRHVERERLILQDAELLNKERKFLESVESEKEQIVKKKEEEVLGALLVEKEKIEQKKREKMEKIKKAEKQRKRIKKKLAEEEMKLKMAKTKLENVELLGMLLEKAKKKKKKEVKKKKIKGVEPIADIVEQVFESVKEEEKDLLVNRELELRTRLLLKYKRNIGISAESHDKDPKEPPDPEPKSEEQKPGLAVPEELVDKILFDDSESEFELVEDDEVIGKLNTDEEVTDEDAEKIVTEQSTEEEATDDLFSIEASCSEESESDGEIKSEGEASDSVSAASVRSEKSVKSFGDTKEVIKKKKLKKEKKRKKNKEKKGKEKEKDVREEKESKVDRRVEVVSNHWKSTTRHYTDRDGKRRGDTWIEGKQVYEIEESRLPPWPCAPDFYGGSQHRGNADAYNRSRSGRRSRSISRDRLCSKGRYMSRRRSRSTSRRRNTAVVRRRSRSPSRWRRRSRSRSRRRNILRRRRSRSSTRSYSTLSLSSSGSRSRSLTSPVAARRAVIKSMSKSPPRMCVRKEVKKPKKTISLVKAEKANVKERPKPLIMKMPSKRPKKVPKAEESVPVKEESQVLPVPEQTIETEKSASPRVASPIPTDSIPLPQSPLKEALQSVQEVPDSAAIEPHIEDEVTDVCTSALV